MPIDDFVGYSHIPEDVGPSDDDFDVDAWSESAQQAVGALDKATATIREHQAQQAEEAFKTIQALIRENAIDGGLPKETQERIAAAALALFNLARREPPRDRLDSPTTFADIVAEHVRARRMAAGWRQQDLAEHIEREGLAWRRVTVAELETRKRRVSWEELIVLAMVLKAPAIQFLTPPDGIDVTISTRHVVTRAQLLDLLLGSGGRMGRMNTDSITTAPGESVDHNTRNKR